MALGNLLAVMAQEAWYQGQTLKVHYQEIQHVLFFCLCCEQVDEIKWLKRVV